MTLDIVVAAVVLLFLLWSYHRGLLRKLAGIGALVIASLASGFVGREAAALATTRWQLASPLAYAAACVLAWVVIFVVALLLLRLIARAIGSSVPGEPKPWNKKLGALFGLAEGLVLCWFIVGLLNAIPEDLRARRLTRLHDQLESSHFNTWVVEPTSPGTLLELQPLIGDLTVVAEHPQALRVVERDPQIQKLLENRKLRAVVQDQELLKEWQAGRISRFFSDRKVREAIEDPELRQMLRDLPVRRILREAAEQARADEKK